MDEEGITIDANHPLAGKDLTFDVEVGRSRLPVGSGDAPRGPAEPH